MPAQLKPKEHGNKKVDSRPTRITVWLVCNHTKIFVSPVPKRGDMVYCFRCEKYQVVKACESEYIFHCSTCNKWRAYRGERTKCTKRCYNHYKDFPGHTIFMLKGEIVEHEWGPMQQALPLPGVYGVDPTNGEAFLF